MRAGLDEGMSEKLMVLDIGNTQTVLGLYEGARLTRHWRVTTHAARTADEFRIVLRGLLDESGVKLDDIDAVALSSVVPPVTRNFAQAFVGKPVLHVSARIAFGFEIAVPLPEQVGADRLVNAEAALVKYGAPAIVVDSGTATTWCAIDSRRRYLGGAIAPGISISTDALFARASKLAGVDLRLPERVIGNTTETALQSGIVNGYIALLDGMIARMKDELGEPGVRVIGTGGWMELLGPASREIQHVDGQLTLDGLYCLWRRSVGRPVEPGTWPAKA